MTTLKLQSLNRIKTLTYMTMDAEKLLKVVLLAIESALASGRQLSWKVQENNVGMLVQLVWKSSESRNLVGSNWNKLKKKPPSRQRRDALRFLKFNAAKAPQQGHSSILDIAEQSSDTLSQELNVPTAASTPVYYYLFYFSRAAAVS